MARAEFLAADLFARHRQVVEPVVGSSGGGEAAQRGSFRTAGELGWLSRGGLTAEEAGVPHARLRQIYAAPASVYMRVTPDALIPEAMRLGPLAEPLLGEDPFGGGLASLRLTGDDAADFADEFFDAILRNSAHETAEPAEGYRMTSVRRKRATKMNKHKHKKLRKRTRALRKRLGK
ncbi:hypothetical protein GGI02_001913 [Coemansia sp. RSA 2322]|uniref:Ribosomal protein mS38 C-terminal domain-containing protein n=1 Tax=Coemansia thaxteri TaxID=2663907 RepID=A0A9W8BKE3_9FUNG|nr:hypothetical protein H4R26_002547 [Coemansia thaxteri]KAJ2471964.1 hypothetical protein GGI02_001913 [Coemansia sp. RSA 2322]KAJ2484774.1 hypothetical protein EV174_002177 [Coemansia sp. RSA 2320]